jgi:hypothetical protein
VTKLDDLLADLLANLHETEKTDSPSVPISFKSRRFRPAEEACRRTYPAPPSSTRGSRRTAGRSIEGTVDVELGDKFVS